MHPKRLPADFRFWIIWLGSAIMHEVQNSCSDERWHFKLTSLEKPCFLSIFSQLESNIQALQNLLFISSPPKTTLQHEMLSFGQEKWNSFLHHRLILHRVWPGHLSSKAKKGGFPSSSLPLKHTSISSAYEKSFKHCKQQHDGILLCLTKIVLHVLPQQLPWLRVWRQ